MNINVIKMVEKLVPVLRFVAVLLLMASATGSIKAQESIRIPDNIVCGAERTDLYIDLIKGKRVGLVANPTSRIGNVHLLDSLMSLGVDVRRIFSPEHGFRGEAEAGETLDDNRDPLTGVEIISVYKKKDKKPSVDEIMDLDLILFDIQDVGVRFYTYISTLHYMMEACAESGTRLIILDRPNPNGFYVDGPVREKGFESFVGVHEVPVVYGMTIGEYGRMINGEGWLNNSATCQLTIISCLNYDHLCTYNLPVKPSPNLPNLESVILYPSLCYFEGSVVSLGRGTDFPFQVYGHPDMTGDFSFTPRSIPGASLHPKHEGELCKGVFIGKEGADMIMKDKRIRLEWVINAYNDLDVGEEFFTGYFDTLMGNSWVREDIIKGVPEDQIREKWAAGVKDFIKVREKYLLYPDFKYGD